MSHMRRDELSENRQEVAQMRGHDSNQTSNKTKETNKRKSVVLISLFMTGHEMRIKKYNV